MRSTIVVILVLTLVLVGFILVQHADAYPMGIRQIHGPGGEIIGSLVIFPDGSYVLADSDPGPPPMSNVVKEGKLHDQFPPGEESYISDDYSILHGTGIAVTVWTWYDPITDTTYIGINILDLEGVLGHGPGPFVLGLPL